MQNGLLYLKLDICELNNADLAQLIGSCHQLTLNELNLSYNDFGCDTSSNNLIRLCQNLPNVQVLDISGCFLESWSINEIKLLIFSIKCMPNIVYLNLTDNIFDDDDTLADNILVLNESPSLRYLKLPGPLGFKCKDLIKSFSFTKNDAINKSRTQLLYIEYAKL
ncbi:unnamed protein product [Meganyctiphanes norvegica]|uniref:Uncharacterized protein n=1 Tax=Meganyctiphanes norvegica TaxID=48144 RepID=A0AAV2RAX7_MEGNR